MEPFTINFINDFIQWTRDGIIMDRNPGNQVLLVANTTVIDRNYNMHHKLFNNSASLSDASNPKNSSIDNKYMDWRPTLKKYF